MLQKPSKTFQKDGRWVENPGATKVVVCTICSAKYIKTRPKQATCIKCMIGAQAR